MYAISAFFLAPVGLALIFTPNIVTDLLGPSAALAGKVSVFGLLFGLGSLLLMPREDGLLFDDHECGLPTSPNSTQPSPEQPIRTR